MNVLHLSLRQLQIFSAIARTGSTTAASKEISLSQSATSAALNELERLLSIHLFERVGKRLVLNENGRALLPRALSLLNDASEIEHMSNGASLQVQSLRIGASTTIGNYVLPKILRQFLSSYLQQDDDSWSSKVLIGNTEKICAAVASFELDIGLVEGPCHEPNLIVTPWIQDELVVVAQGGKKKKNEAPQKLSLETLQQQLWLLRESGSGTRESTDQLLLPYLGSYKRSMEMGSSEAIRNAVEQGLGVSYLSRWVVNEAIKSGRLRYLNTPLPLSKRQSYIVIHRNRVQTMMLQNFLKELSIERLVDE